MKNHTPILVVFISLLYIGISNPTATVYAGTPVKFSVESEKRLPREIQKRVIELYKYDNAKKGRTAELLHKDGKTYVIFSLGLRDSYDDIIVDKMEVTDDTHLNVVATEEMSQPFGRKGMGYMLEVPIKVMSVEDVNHMIKDIKIVWNKHQDES